MARDFYQGNSLRSMLERVTLLTCMPRKKKVIGILNRPKKVVDFKALGAKGGKATAQKYGIEFSRERARKMNAKLGKGRGRGKGRERLVDNPILPTDTGVDT